MITRKIIVFMLTYNLFLSSFNITAFLRFWREILTSLGFGSIKYRILFTLEHVDLRFSIKKTLFGKFYTRYFELEENLLDCFLLYELFYVNNSDPDYSKFYKNFILIFFKTFIYLFIRFDIAAKAFCYALHTWVSKLFLFSFVV